MKYQSSAIAATSMSGKSGGTVATTTGTIRRKSNPRQPNTPGQQLSKNILGILASSWAALDPADQDTWNIAAANSAFMKDGERKKLTGLDMFIKTNKILVMAGQEILTAYVQPIQDLYIDSITAGAGIFEGGNFIVVSLSGTGSIGEWLIMAEATQSMSSGRRYMKSKSKYLGVFTPEGVDINIGAAYTEKFGLLIIGQRIEIQVFATNPNTGQQTTKVSTQVIVQNFDA